MANKSKNNKPKDVKKDDKKATSNNSGFKQIVFLASAVIIGLVGMYIYNNAFNVPELPKLDMNQWWGPLPMDTKQDVSIRPFEIEFSDVIINDLKERLLHTRQFAPPLENIGFQYGFNSNYLTRVLDYWKNNYNFKDREQFLNQFNHFKTNIQGLDIHFMHVKPKTKDGVQTVPLLLLHGWPGSIREFYELIPKLTAARQYNFVFEVIVPSLPGYGFSQAAVRPGLNALEVAVIMNNLMRRLGHEKYYVQGGDYGHIIGTNMATMFPGQVLGFHTNMPMVTNSMSIVKTFIGAYFPSLIVEPGLESRMYPWTEKFFTTLEETGYFHIQATKPDTIGIALTDSPAGLAAYILEKFSTWTNPEYRESSDGGLLNKFALTHLLDNIMIYWTTNTITTSMRLYAETFNKIYLGYNLDSIPTPVPTWGLKMKHELGFQPDSILKHKYTNYLHSTVVEDGGHFAAFEMPDLVADDVFHAVATFREFHKHKNEGNYAETIYAFTVKDINGKEVKLDKYRGHVVIIVNVASHCGYTSTNYQQLNELYDKYGQSKGLRILAFPCNQFNSQEPGTAKDILTFTKSRGVKFDLFEKVDVNGDNAHPLWQFLKRTQAGTLGDFIKWNFSKFIIDKNGVPVERLGPNVDPVDLVPLLEKYW